MVNEYGITEKETKEALTAALRLQAIANEYGVTAKEASEALIAAMRLLPPPGKEDIELIKRNPTLNWWQKWKLIRQIKGMQHEILE